MNSDKWLIIGISGVTCGGKTTLAKKIHQSLTNSVLIQQDNYFLPVDDKRQTEIPELNHINWELCSSMDMKKMEKDILEMLNLKTMENNDEERSKKKVLVLEGYLLYESKVISNLCDLKYFLTLTKEQCWERRKDRVYDPPDVPGYFERAVWPEYVRYESKMKHDKTLNKPVTFIDGSKNEEETFQLVFSEIKKLLS